MSLRFAVLIGSTRQNNNNIGVANWIKSVLRSRPLPKGAPDGSEITVVDPATWPLGPLLGPGMAAAVIPPAKYDDPVIQSWSEFVQSCAGLVVVSPQYNWGYPGELKNALDHLFHELKDKPVMLVTYGGRGGSKAAAQLTEVLAGGLKMKLVEPQVAIVLPPPYIRTNLRVSHDASIALHGTEADHDPFLKEYQAITEQAADALLRATQPEETAAPA